MVRHRKVKKKVKKKLGKKLIGIFVGIIVALFFSVLVWGYQQKVEIIYFTNKNCVASKHTDEIITSIQKEFGEKVNIQRIEVKIFPGDGEDDAYVSGLRKKYKVYGVPFIVIEGKVFNKPYTKENLVKEICERFIFFKPRACERK